MEADSIRYYCTAGNGMEPFLIDELKKKLKAEDVCPLPGKVVFRCCASIQRVRELKTAERLFLLLKYDKHVRVSATAAQATSLLQSRLQGDSQLWTEAVVTWNRLQAELLGSVQQEDTREKKRKREEEEEQEQEEQQERKSVKLDVRVQKDRKLLESSDEEEEGGASLRAQHSQSGSVCVSFRISCKCTGSLSRCLNSQEVSKVVGVAVSRLMGWTCDLKNPQVEINVNLSDDQWIWGIPLTRSPLAKRNYLLHGGLRSTVSWAMGSLAHIQPGFLVLDPMCGVGTVLVEAARENQEVCFLGVDVDDGQLQRANQNVSHANLEKQIHLLKASCLALPVPSASVDAVVCDLPFGRKFGSELKMKADLSIILSELERVLRPGGFLVLLLSPQLSFHLKRHLSSGKALQQPPPTRAPPQDGTIPPPPPTEEAEITSPLSSLEHRSSHRVSLGAIDGLIHEYVKVQ